MREDEGKERARWGRTRSRPLSEIRRRACVFVRALARARTYVCESLSVCVCVRAGSLPRPISEIRRDAGRTSAARQAWHWSYPRRRAGRWRSSTSRPPRTVGTISVQTAGPGHWRGPVEIILKFCCVLFYAPFPSRGCDADLKIATSSKYSSAEDQIESQRKYIHGTRYRPNLKILFDCLQFTSNSVCDNLILPTLYVQVTILID